MATVLCIREDLCYSEAKEFVCKGDFFMKKVLVTLPLEAEHKEQLLAAGAGCEMIFLDLGEVTEADIAAADILIGNVPAGMISGAPNLEWVQLGSSGADAYVKPGVLHPATKLTNSTGAYSKAVAEHALAATMMLQKNLHHYRDNQLAARWQDSGYVTSIADAVVAVIGLGEIGLHYARMAKALGACVLGVKRRPGECPACVDELYTMEGLDEVLSRADVVFTVLPETPATHHLFTKERFEIMKSSAIFINCGRGGAVAEDVLYEALSTHQIAKASIDVAEREPLPADSPLWGLEDLFITPHVSGDFHLRETHDRVVSIAAENLGRYLRGEELLNPVDFETGYRK